MKESFQTLAKFLRGSLQALHGKAFAASSGAATAPLEAAPPLPPRSAAALVKSRPASLEQRYALLDHRELADEVFRRLQERVFATIAEQRQGHRSQTVFCESGKLQPGRPYFYVKPQDQKGWLFERSGAGWVVTPAEKIVARDLFLREETPLDSVLLYMARDRATMPRVKSQVVGDDLLAFAYYEQKLLQQLGLS